jgi:hypothetical protein
MRRSHSSPSPDNDNHYPERGDLFRLLMKIVGDINGFSFSAGESFDNSTILA